MLKRAPLELKLQPTIFAAWYPLARSSLKPARPRLRPTNLPLYWPFVKRREEAAVAAVAVFTSCTRDANCTDDELVGYDDKYRFSVEGSGRLAAPPTATASEARSETTLLCEGEARKRLRGMERESRARPATASSQLSSRKEQDHSGIKRE